MSAVVRVAAVAIASIFACAPFCIHFICFFFISVSLYHSHWFVYLNLISNTRTHTHVRLANKNTIHSYYNTSNCNQGLYVSIFWCTTCSTYAIQKKTQNAFNLDFIIVVVMYVKSRAIIKIRKISGKQIK